jgi:hypothetical protein
MANNLSERQMINTFNSDKMDLTSQEIADKHKQGLNRDMFEIEKLITKTAYFH